MIKNKEHIETILKEHYDPREDRERVVRNLMFSGFTKPPLKRDAAVLDSWYRHRVGEIAREEQTYRQRLEQARKEGNIDETEYIRAIMDLGTSSCPFRKARQEASELYSKERKLI
ncbi:hypothetical protein B6U80_00280 [Candidatus Pacearchaeota archaeon ex4484_26]|nr:MAG: hypothetical protein B6U80_00280 [Candidatus Pacearchaeota archaeon ex4484_26]